MEAPRREPAASTPSNMPGFARTGEMRRGSIRVGVARANEPSDVPGTTGARKGIVGILRESLVFGILRGRAARALEHSPRGGQPTGARRGGSLHAIESAL